MPLNASASGNLQEVKFHLHKITFIPYVNSTKQNTNDILFDVITFLNREQLNGKAYAINRNKNKPELEKRELFVYSAARVAQSKKFKCSIALINDKSLMVKPADAFTLVPYDKAKGSITILTHFYIDYSVSPAIICAQFNNEGPRVSDIEFYFRSLAVELGLAKGCQITTYLHAPIDDTLGHLRNVLNFEIKLRPQSIAQMDDDIKSGLISDFANIGNRLKPSFIRIEAMFQTPGAKIKSEHLNKEANSFIKMLLKKFKEKPFHIDQFDEFELKFVNDEGENDVFNLIKGKREIVVQVDRTTHMTTTKYYNLIQAEFDQFIESFRS
ncbi:hypothetical protein DYU05_00335 [Mucilaginibacter terrenus]|uniref:Uncharacterized protein n=1 Tax=Mucilaginibacter terrenus TaxID=2482727 RepID=A0A3E2NT71_9SPHI|nr:hypothetical protein [Mucilaginibacter terrenus]RFZ84121.1 hypothetical protein DYU05_00335 [Mucilaginibacter terrenus]